MIRRLLASVLLPALLLGARAPEVALRPAAEGATTAFVAVEAISAGPALPGNAGTSLLSTFDVPIQPRMCDRRGPDAPHALGGRDPVEWSRAAQLDRCYLHYARALERARLSLPATCGNPPPASVV